MVLSSRLLLLALNCVLVASHTELWTKFHEVAEWQGKWADSVDKHLGQECDAENETVGCVTLFVADPGDEFDLSSVPLNEQNNFLNTQWYGAAWTLHGHGILGQSLPRAPEDFLPVCYIANVSGRIVMGYEEGAGDVLLPCPGADKAVPFTEEQILSPNADLEDMCSQCYFTVCSGRRARDPRYCGGRNQGGVAVGYSRRSSDTVAELVKQATPTYHCHLTMTDENGACDYMQHEQHQEDEGYRTQHATMCGWEKVRHLNVSICDCTKEAGRHDRCSKQECLNLAFQGVVCGNCWGCSQRRAHDSIFVPSNTHDEYDGVCAHVRTAATEPERNFSRMMCSKSIFCRDKDRWGSGCDFHCEHFGVDSDVWVDPRCMQHQLNAARRLLDHAPIPAAPPLDLDTELGFGELHPGFPPIKASRFALARR